MTGTNCDLFTHKSSRLYLNHVVINRVKFLRVYRVQASSYALTSDGFIFFFKYAEQVNLYWLPVHLSEIRFCAAIMQVPTQRGEPLLSIN
jgi:hypothetical protein